jgi:hypothetical protein
MDRVTKIDTGKPALQTVLHDFLGKDCMAGSVLLYFLFSLVITHARSPKRTCIKFLLGLCAVPLEGYVHVNVYLLFVFALPLHVQKKSFKLPGRLAMEIANSTISFLFLLCNMSWFGLTST